MKPQEVVAQHLDAVGPEAARAAARNLEGSCALAAPATGGVAGALLGRFAFDSEASRFALRMKFTSQAYPAESSHLLESGKGDVAFVLPGKRSGLGNFVNTNDVILREGLLGGVLNAGWPLFGLARRGARVSYDGLKNARGVSSIACATGRSRVVGRRDSRGVLTRSGARLHAALAPVRRFTTCRRPVERLAGAPLVYPSQDSLDVFLYFDPDTFRHVASVYSGSPARQRVRRRTSSRPSSEPDYDLQMQETFGDAVGEGPGAPHLVDDPLRDAGQGDAVPEVRPRGRDAEDSPRGRAGAAA